MELEIQNDNLKLQVVEHAAGQDGHWNAIALTGWRVDEYEKKANGHWDAIVKAESKIIGLQLQVDGLIASVAQLKDAKP